MHASGRCRAPRSPEAEAGKQTQGNIDPYLNQNDVGRVRHLYVSPKYRGSGVGLILLKTIIEEAKKHFNKLTLYTENPVADKLYINSGFTRVEGIFKASHIIELAK
ncbi:GNAT family N-acetyltransferase [Paenibacillus tarimensis]